MTADRRRLGELVRPVGAEPVDSGEAGNQLAPSIAGLVWSRLWLIVVAVLTGGGAAALASSMQTPIYEARATVALERRVGDGLFEAGLTQEKTVETEIRIATGPPVQQLVAEQLGQNVTATAAPIPGARLFEIIARDQSGEAAARIANTYAEVYVGERKRQVVEDLSVARDALDQQIQALQQEIDSIVQEVMNAPADQRITLETNLGARRNALVSEQAIFRQQFDQLGVAAELRTGAVSILTPAAVPREPVSPDFERYVALGSFSALIIAVAAAVLLR